ncbi:MAG TPA: hypothetical protein PLN31_10350 [Azoarcus taiwanensis]|nr:hypothetical protein [Azoarcus taiwanensis]
MNLFDETGLRLRWLLSLAITIWRLSARQVVTTVAIFIVGQLSLVIAMLLPLKAILLAASDGVPWYLASLVTAETKDTFIVALVLGALLAYGANLLIERLIAGQLRSGTSRILDKSRKLSLFPNERKLVSTNYLRFCRIVASGILFALMTALGLLLAPPLFVIMLGLIVAEYGIAHVILRRDSVTARDLIKAFQEDRGRLLSILTNLTFLIGFVVMFAQFLASNERNAILAIVTFILLRQMTNRLRLAVQEFIALSADRHRISPLFHSHIRYVPPAKQGQESFLFSMRPAQRHQWIAEVLSDVASKPVSGIIDSRWNDTSSLGISAIDVRVHPPDASSKPERARRKRFDFFLRCFSAPHWHLAEHEARLFEHDHPPALAPRYLGKSKVGDFVVLIFEGLPVDRPSRTRFIRSRRTLLRVCEQSPIDALLLEQYQRTHQTLPQRLTTVLLDRLHTAAASQADKTALRTLRKSLPDIRSALSELPLALDNPDLAQQFSRIDEDGQILIWAWHRWRLDTLTARSFDGDEGKPTDLESVRATVDYALAGRRGLRILASFMSELENELQRGLFDSALQRIGAINELWTRIRYLVDPHSADAHGNELTAG